MNTAKMIIDRDYTLVRTDEKLFCSFAEPLGRCIYGGLYEPGHPSADEKGFRRDVLDLIRPRTGTACVEDGVLCAELDPLSWSVIHLQAQQ